MKVLFDSNVIIDALSERDDANKYSSILFLEAVDSRIIQGYLLSKQITDIYYVLRKYKLDEEIRKDFVNLLLKTFKVIDTKPDDLLKSLFISGTDYEDDIIMYAALNSKVDCIVTNDIKDFKNSKVKVLTPEELVNKLDLV
ncbi:MAG: PIN domain-containing protein [Acholeplasmatales bacterium]|nr:PIN domain-containing protein [Acholeplasmatales bacterium]